MTGARCRQTISSSAVNSTGPRVDGALLQLMRVLVDIAGNTQPVDLAVRGKDSTHASTPVLSPHSRDIHSRGCSEGESRLVENPASSRELPETPVFPARAEAD